MRAFWIEVSRAFDRIAADPVESATQRAEMQLWDHGTVADYANEEW